MFDTQPTYRGLAHSVKKLFFLWEKTHCFPSLTSSWLKKPDLVVLSHCAFLAKLADPKMPYVCSYIKAMKFVNEHQMNIFFKKYTRKAYSAI